VLFFSYPFGISLIYIILFENFLDSMLKFMLCVYLYKSRYILMHMHIFMHMGGLVPIVVLPFFWEYVPVSISILCITQPHLNPLDAFMLIYS
jgi:hypothetical protein